jgi:hypothetical protein
MIISVFSFYPRYFFKAIVKTNHNNNKGRLLLKRRGINYLFFFLKKKKKRTETNMHEPAETKKEDKCLVDLLFSGMSFFE